MVYEDFDFSIPANLLVEGENILAFHGLNSSRAGSDFLAGVRMDGGSILTGDGGQSYDCTPITLPAGAVKVSARVLDGDEWSAVTEATFLVDTQNAAPGNLVISELHYNPEGGRDAEFVELLNTSDKTINLEGIHFSSGIEFTFLGSHVLGAGERVVIVSNLDSFQQIYGDRIADISIAGEYDRNLSNAGRRSDIVRIGRRGDFQVYL